MSIQLVTFTETRKLPDGTEIKPYPIHPHGFPKGYIVGSIAELHQNLGTVLTELMAKDSRNKRNLYFTMGHHSGLGGDKPSRLQSTFVFQTGLQFDIDYVDTQRCLEYAVAVGQVLAVSPSKLVVNCSGYGVQIFAHLRNPYRGEAVIRELKPAYNEIVYKIGVELKKMGLKFDKVDPVVWDAARLMRVPGTINSKPGRADKEAFQVQYDTTEFDIDLMEISGLNRIKKENISSSEVKRTYPKPDVAEVTKECRFIQWCLEHSDQIHEPDFFSLVLILGNMPEERKIIHDGQDKTPREICEWIFERATASASLARSDFEAKWAAASRYGVPLCGTIETHCAASCGSCPHKGKIPSPIALKSKEHIGSEVNGYWVLNAKGVPMHPHYGDLARLYKSETAYVVTGDDIPRLFNFEHSHFKSTAWSLVRGWVEKTVTPTDPIRDVHCRELTKKIEREGIMRTTSADFLFTESVKGKLNCANGVLDIKTGELLPHSPEFGFKYVLPYQYQIEETSDLFLDWLSLVMKDNPDLMESLLDIMAYCLWPQYDDHVFVFLVGDGRNGKSTFIKILQELLGRANYSAVSIQQLGTNRFAPALLEGKLANLFSESSGYRMSLEEMNVIKNLSAGEEFTAEKKGVQGYSVRNMAKLIFSANKPPQFQESGHALESRLLAIPFDHTIRNPDPKVELQLISEVSKILPILIRRIQENISQNGGHFKVFRGGQSAHRLQQNLLEAGNNVSEWGKECLDSRSEYKDDDYIIASSAYVAYAKWCGVNGYRAFNKGLFSQYMYRFVVSSVVDKDKNKIRVAGKEVRVFKRVKWKDEE